jgi:tRNA (mo5U34)-methyltransferase
MVTMTDALDEALQALPMPEQVARLGPWFHNLHLPDGTQTAPAHALGDFPHVKWRQVAPHVPADLHGWRVLDIGCNAGFYSLEFARRGGQVTAVDVDAHYLAQAQWAARQFGLSSQIEFRRASVYQLVHEREEYDLVWFLGVLYHLRHPLLALDILRRLTRRMLVLQTMTMPGRTVLNPPPGLGLEDREIMRRDGWPLMAFIEGELANDPTNWWAPNHAAVLAMLRSAGFRITGSPAHEIYLCEPDPNEGRWHTEMREFELRTVCDGREWGASQPPASAE